MKIAVIAPIEESVPPKKYGGTEWIVYYVANGIANKDHQVDLYASGDSKKDAHYNLIPTVSTSIRVLPEYRYDLKMREAKKFIVISKIVEQLMKNGYDLIHNHYGWRFLLYSNFLKMPILTTHHGPLSTNYQNLVFLEHKNQPYVSISNNQRKDLPELNFIDTVYNGIDVSTFPYSEDRADKSAPMAFLARMNNEKGGIEAATAAQITKKKLIVAAKVDKVDEPYFANFKPFINNESITFIGEVNHEKRIDLLQNARCLIIPIKWEEPFGLMFIEAMACGTPVITYARGSVPEIIKDGVTGFIVNSSERDNRGDWLVKKTGIDGLCEAIERIYSMPEEQYRQMRRNCRSHVEKNFTVEKMVDQYEKVYEKILKGKN